MLSMIAGTYQRIQVSCPSRQVRMLTMMQNCWCHMRMRTWIQTNGKVLWLSNLEGSLQETPATCSLQFSSCCYQRTQVSRETLWTSLFSTLLLKLSGQFGTFFWDLTTTVTYQLTKWMRRWNTTSTECSTYLVTSLQKPKPFTNCSRLYCYQ